MLIWLTNFLIFGLWYWEIDRGGPGQRAWPEKTRQPDFLFPQMTDDSDRAARLAAAVHRLPLRLTHECDRILAHRHDAADA